MYFADYVRKSPCLNCNKRNLGCHAHCITFKKYKAKVIEYNMKEYQEENMEKAYRSIVSKWHRNFI